MQPHIHYDSVKFRHYFSQNNKRVLTICSYLEHPSEDSGNNYDISLQWTIYTHNKAAPFADA